MPMSCHNPLSLVNVCKQCQGVALCTMHAMVAVFIFVTFIIMLVLLRGRGPSFQWRTTPVAPPALTLKATQDAAMPDGPTTALAALALQGELRKLCTETKNGIRATQDSRRRIEELVKELNKLNPTAEPALSPLISGKWRMLFTNVPGPSSGRVGPFVGDVYQDINAEKQRIRNILELGPEWALRGALEADVEVLDGSNWAINFDVVNQCPTCLFTSTCTHIEERGRGRESTHKRAWEAGENGPFPHPEGSNALQASDTGNVSVTPLQALPPQPFRSSLPTPPTPFQVYNKFAGVTVQKKRFDRKSTERRIWQMTYLDPGFRVLYGRKESLSEEDGFIFILERV
ncbi:unnamed protein product [Discosporangium mesarthrocarpum]